MPGAMCPTDELTESVVYMLFLAWLKVLFRFRFFRMAKWRCGCQGQQH
jgi:hypothetical protein